MIKDDLSRRGLMGAAIDLLGSSIAQGILRKPLKIRRAVDSNRQVASMLGTAVSNDVLRDPAARKVILDNFQGITCDSAMKCRVIAREKGKYDFTSAEEAVRFAERYRLRMRGHTLLWHKAMPAWLNELIVTGEGAHAVQKYIHTVATYFRGRLMAWDVVNEPLSDSWDSSSGPLKPTILTKCTSPDIIPEAFFISHEADSHTKKYLNDFFFLLPDDRCRQKMKNCLRYAEKLLSDGVPIHGIGIQGHLNAGNLVTFKERVNFFSEIVNLGLDVSVTELDVRDLIRRKSVQARDDAVASTVDDFMGSLAYAGVECPVFTWGLSDKYHSRVKIDKIGKGRQRPDPFDERLQQKKLMTVLQRYTKK